MIGNRYGSEFGGIAALMSGVGSNERQRDNTRFQDDMSRRGADDEISRMESERQERVAAANAQNLADIMKLQYQVAKDGRDFGLQERRFQSEDAERRQGMGFARDAYNGALGGNIDLVRAANAGRGKDDTQATLANLLFLGGNEADIAKFAAIRDGGVSADDAFSLNERDLFRSQNMAMDIAEMEQRSTGSASKPTQITPGESNAIIENIFLRAAGGDEELAAEAKQRALKDPARFGMAELAMNKTFQETGNPSAAKDSFENIMFGGTGVSYGDLPGWFSGDGFSSPANPVMDERGFPISTGKTPDQDAIKGLIDNAGNPAYVQAFVREYGADVYDSISASQK